MADLPKEEFPPLLPPGFYDLGVDGIERLCVDRFPDSVTRRRIMANLKKIIAMIQTNGMHGEVWVNGGFLTEKLNPEDVDIILVIPADEYRKMSAEQKKFYEWFRDIGLRDTFKVDNYAFILDNSAFGEWTYAYWLRQFGFSRGDKMKGLAVVKVPFLVTP